MRALSTFRLARIFDSPADTTSIENMNRSLRDRARHRMILNRLRQRRARHIRNMFDHLAARAVHACCRNSIGNCFKSLPLKREKEHAGIFYGEAFREKSRVVLPPRFTRAAASGGFGTHVTRPITLACN